MKLFENYIYYKITFLIILFFILVKFTLDHSPFSTGFSHTKTAPNPYRTYYHSDKHGYPKITVYNTIDLLYTFYIHYMGNFVFLLSL